MPSCAVITCRARSQVSSVAQGGISFHRFPKERRLREQWIKITGRVHWVPTKTSTICSRHFSDDDFIMKTSGNRFLRLGAVPCQKIVKIHSNLDVGTATFDTTEVKTEILEDHLSTEQLSGDSDEPLRAKPFATIVIDPLRLKHCSTSSNAESNASRDCLDNKVIENSRNKEETCDEHINRIESLLKANRRLCRQNKNLKRILMIMKKKIKILEDKSGKSFDDDSN